MAKKTDLGINIKLSDLVTPALKKIESAFTGLGNKITSISNKNTSALGKQKNSLKELATATDKNSTSTKKFEGSLGGLEQKFATIQKRIEYLQNKKITLKTDDTQLQKTNEKLAKLEQNRDKLAGQINKERSSNTMKFGGKLIAGGAALTYGGMRLKDKLTNYHDQYAEVAKSQGELMTLGIDQTGVDAITAKGKDFSSKYAGVTTKDFISAAYDIKSGISSLSNESVGEMTNIAALTARATKSNVEQMTSLFATGYNIYSGQFDAFASKTIVGWNNLSQEEKDIKFGESFSNGISKAVQVYKTKGSEMEGYISMLGSSATNAGASMQEQFAIGGMLQATMSGSEAATRYKSFIKGAASAGGELHLKFTDANNQLLGTAEILDVLRKKYGNTLDAMEKTELTKAFGSDEAIAFIDLLYNKTDKLREGITELQKSSKQGLGLTKEMADAANMGQSSERLNHNLDNLASTIGKTLDPAMGVLADVVGGAVKALDGFITEHSTVASVIGTSLVVLSLGAMAFGAIATTAGMAAIGLSALGVGGFAARGGMFAAATGATTLTGSLVGLLRLAGPLVAFMSIMAGLGIAAGKNQMVNRSAGKGVFQLISDKKEIQGLIDAKKNGGLSGAYASLTDTRSINQLEKIKAKKDKDIAYVQKLEAKKAIDQYKADKLLNNLKIPGAEGSSYVPKIPKGSGGGGGGGGGKSKYGLKQHAEDLIRNNNIKTAELGDRLTIPCPISSGNSWGEKGISSKDKTSNFSLSGMIGDIIGKDTIEKAISLPKNILTSGFDSVSSMIKEGDIHISIDGYQKDALELAREVEAIILKNRQSRLDRSFT